MTSPSIAQLLVMPKSTAPRLEGETPRRSPRASVLRLATATYGRDSTSECLVLDLSDCGAKLRVADLPNSTEVIDLRLDNGATHHCRVVWRDEETLGVEFVDKVTPKQERVTQRREHRRDSTLRRGQIVFQDGHCVIDCTILDLSKSGARIRPLNLMGCPDIFELRVTFGANRPCKVVRREGTDLGVRFLDLED